MSSTYYDEQLLNRSIAQIEDNAIKVGNIITEIERRIGVTNFVKIDDLINTAVHLGELTGETTYMCRTIVNCKGEK